MSEKRIHLKLKIRGTFFSDIVWPGVNWACYGVFVDIRGAHIVLGTLLQLYTKLQPLYQFVYTSTRESPVNVHLSRRMAHTLLGTVIMLYRCTLFQALYTCTICSAVSLHSTATWRQPGLSFFNETSQGFTKQTPNTGWTPKAGHKGKSSTKFVVIVLSF